MNYYNKSTINFKLSNTFYKFLIFICSIFAFNLDVSAQCGFEWVETNLCTVDFEVNTGTGLSYEIDMGGETILNSSNGPIFSYQFNGPGNYTLILTYYNNNKPACGASYNITIVDCDNCDLCNTTPPGISFNIDPNGNNGCLVEFLNTEGSHFCPVPPGCEPELFTPYYEVDYGDGSPVVIQNNVHCAPYEYSCNGAYTFCITYFFPGPCGEICEVEACEEIIIEDCGCCVECPTLEVETSNCHATVCAHTECDEGAEYSWIVNGKPFDDDPNGDGVITHTFDCDGTYTVCLIYSVDGEVICPDNPDEPNCITFEIEDCGECPCDGTPPTNLQVLPGGVLNWDPVSGAEGYIISSPPGNQQILDCNCKWGVSMAQQIVTAPPFALPGNLPNQCFVWQVQTVCADGTISDVSEQHCYPSTKFILTDETDGPIKGTGPRKMSNPNVVNDEIVLYPNPATNNFFIEVNAVESENLNVQLFDQSGRLLMENNKQSLKGYNKFNFNTADIPRGIYILKIASNNIHQHKKIVLAK